jgi:hypothetical protein
MKRFFLLTTLALGTITPSLQAQSMEDQQAIKQLCGCFAVTFNYAETFITDSTKATSSHLMDTNAVLEYEFPLESSPNKIVIQHVLLVPGGPMIKHWREEWVYEQTTLWKYDKDKEWVKTTLSPEEVKGKWTQSVWEVSDAPRYQGMSSWVNTNNELFWINTTDAPLPRREYTIREDYNVLNRTNRIIVSNKGYMHEQDNKKIIRRAGQPDSILAYEKGYNNYVRMPDEACKGAQAFWTREKAAFWADVRAVWAEMMNKANRIKVSDSIDDLLLYEALDKVEDQNLTGEKRKKAIERVMIKYIRILA